MACGICSQLTPIRKTYSPNIIQMAPAVARGWPTNVIPQWYYRGAPRPAPATQLFGASPGIQKWNGVSSLNPTIQQLPLSWLATQQYAASPGVQRPGQTTQIHSISSIRQMQAKLTSEQIQQNGPAAVSWAKNLGRTVLGGG